MASHSGDANGSSDISPDEHQEDLSKYDTELNNIIYNVAVIESELQEHTEVTNRLEKKYSDRRDDWIAHQKSKDFILLDINKLPEIHEAHKTMIERLDDMQSLIRRLWSTLDFREADQRNKVIKYKKEIDDKLLEIEMSKTNKGKALRNQELDGNHRTRILSLEKLVDQCKVNQESLKSLKRKYNDTQKNIERIKETQASIFARLQTVTSFVEGVETAIINQQTGIAELTATVNEQAGPSVQQVHNVKEQRKLNVEEEVSGQTEMKPQMHEKDESEEMETEDQNVFKKRSPDDD